MQLHKTTLGATNSVASRLPCEIYAVRGYFRGAVDSWLQIHDASQLPANGAVPKFTIPLYATAYFAWDWPRGLELANGCIVAVSTAEATLTISTEVADIHVDGSASLVLDTPSVVGNLTTERSDLDLFSASSILYQIKVRKGTNAATGDLWAHVFLGKQVADLSLGTHTPTYRYKFEDDTDSINRTFSFGKSGILAAEACVAASSTGPTFTGLAGGDELLIEAVYKTQ